MVLKAGLSIQCWSRPESVFRFNPDVAALGLTPIKFQRNGFDFIFLDPEGMGRKDSIGQAGFTGLTAPVKCGSAEIGSDPEQ